MDAAWYCRCCYSKDLLENLCSPELDVYSLIYNTQGAKDDHTQIAACLRCREFLKDVHIFMTERREVDKFIYDKLDIKPHKGQLILRSTTDDNSSQIEIKREIAVEYDEMYSETSKQLLKSSLVSNIVYSNICFQDPVNLAKDNLLVVLHDIKNHPLYKHAQKRMIHLNNHKPHKCSECSYTTTDKRCLKDHIACKHSDEKPFSCEMCGFRCKLKNNLRRHVRLHTNANEKSHKCSECSFTTINKGHLKTHIVRKHSVVKPFSCDLCDYLTADKYQFKIHNLRHLSDDKKPFKCGKCSYTTIDKRNLRAHVASKHSEEKPFSCDKCDYRGKLKRSLSRHSMIHLVPQKG